MSIHHPIDDLVRPEFTKNEEGFALVLVLWFLILLGLLSANLLQEARATHHAASTHLMRLQAQAATDGAINLVIQRLLNSPESMPISLNGEYSSMRLFDRDIAVKIEDEAGKIDINTANLQLLYALLQSVAAPPPEADFIARNVVAWRSPSGNAVNDKSDTPYLEAGRLYGPRHGPFRAVPELRLVLGMTDPIQTAVAPLITIWSWHAGIDRRVASDIVLGALAAASDNLAILELRRRQNGSDVSTRNVIVSNHTFSITTQFVSNDIIVRRHAVVKFVNGKRKPYIILNWI